MIMGGLFFIGACIDKDEIYPKIACLGFFVMSIFSSISHT
jgi:hypothetical protein